MLSVSPKLIPMSKPWLVFLVKLLLLLFIVIIIITFIMIIVVIIMIIIVVIVVVVVVVIIIIAVIVLAVMTLHGSSVAFCLGFFSGIVSQTLAAQGGPDFLRACQGRSELNIAILLNICYFLSLVSLK